MSERDCCPICGIPFKPDDLCATDIDEGPCHAECLAGSPVVDLDTGEEIPAGKLDTYRYSEIMDDEEGTAILRRRRIRLLIMVWFIGWLVAALIARLCGAGDEIALIFIAMVYISAAVGCANMLKVRP